MKRLPTPPLLPEAGLMTKQELATCLRTSEDHVTRLTRMGLIPSIRLGRRYVYDAAAIRGEFLKNGGAIFEGGWRKAAVR